MDVYFYETNDGEYLSLLGLTDRITKFTSERLMCGGEKLEAVFSQCEANSTLIKPDRVIEIPDVFSGIITGIKISAVGSYTVSAVSFAGLLSRRVLSVYSSNDSFMTLIEKNCGENALKKRVFPDTYIDKTVDCTFKVTASYKNKSLSKAINSVISKDFRVCSEIVHNDEGARIRIFGRYAVDRSISSGDELPVLLSENYDTLDKRAYSYSENGSVNSAFIYSEEKYGSSGELLYESWRSYFGEESGYCRIEAAYEVQPVTHYRFTLGDGCIIYSEELDYTRTGAAAEALFISRYSPAEEVISALTGNGVREAVRSGSLDVGDKISIYPDDCGEKSARRITKICEKYENGAFEMSIAFGNSE